MNEVCLIGRLTKDPLLRYTSNGTPVTSFTLAVNRSFKNDKGETDADFIPIIVWNKAGESCSTYLRKGSQVAVKGRIQTRYYDDEQGIRHFITEVIASYVKFLDTKSENTTKQDNPILDGIEVEVRDEDIPF